MQRIFSIVSLASLALGFTTASSLAASVDGVWMRTDGAAKVQFAPCGSAECGSIVWLKKSDGRATIGERVFFGMAQTASNTWAGTAHNPEDGNDYDGTMTLSGSRLTTQGCAMGGMICKSQTWSRTR